MATERLYPTRQRCKACNKKLTEENVLSSLYCSLKCGKYSTPAKTVEEAPRGCKREQNNTWVYKKKFSHPTAVPQKYLDDPATNVYECENCHRYHMGHSRPDTSHDPLKDKLSTSVSSWDAVGEVVRKYREAKNIDKKMLAKALKIPAIRITEIEAGDPNVKLGTLFKVLDSLKITVTLNAQAARKS